MCVLCVCGWMAVCIFFEKPTTTLVCIYIIRFCSKPTKKARPAWHYPKGKAMDITWFHYCLSRGYISLPVGVTVSIYSFLFNCWHVIMIWQNVRDGTDQLDGLSNYVISFTMKAPFFLTCTHCSTNLSELLSQIQPQKVILVCTMHEIIILEVIIITVVVFDVIVSKVHSLTLKSYFGMYLACRMIYAMSSGYKSRNSSYHQLLKLHVKNS